ncbi:unnamed protein product [Prunus armeniaca]
MSELVPFNHLPIEGENDTLHPISGSGASLRGLFAQPHLLKLANHASTSEMSCGEPELGVADKTLHKVISVLGNQIKSIILKASLERLPSFKDELGKLLTTLDNVRADVSSLRVEELKKEQEQLELRLHQLNESLSESDVQLSYHCREVTRLREDKIAVEGAPILSVADAETLNTLQVSFERLRNGFKDLSWE